MTTKLELPAKPTLKDYQDYMATMVVQRGFDHESVQDIMLLMVEECGELAKSLRKRAGIKTDSSSKDHSIELELADVFMYVLHMANTCEIDLETAFRSKEEINKQRKWS